MLDVDMDATDELPGLFDGESEFLGRMLARPMSCVGDKGYRLDDG